MAGDEDNDLLPEELKYSDPLYQKMSVYLKLMNMPPVSAGVLKLWVKWRGCGKPMLRAGGMLDQPAYLWGKMWQLETTLGYYLKLKHLSDKQKNVSKSLDGVVKILSEKEEAALRTQGAFGRD